jgi:hypothetical protein
VASQGNLFGSFWRTSEIRHPRATGTDSGSLKFHPMLYTKREKRIRGLFSLETFVWYLVEPLFDLISRCQIAMYWKKWLSTELEPRDGIWNWTPYGFRKWLPCLFRYRAQASSQSRINYRKHLESTSPLNAITLYIITISVSGKHLGSFVRIKVHRLL